MRTRGFKAWRFRKRYYVEHMNHDSYPTGLGTWIARKIPGNGVDYLAWLEAERRMADKWEAKWDKSLAVKLHADLYDDDPEKVNQAGLLLSMISSSSGCISLTWIERSPASTTAFTSSWTESRTSIGLMLLLVGAIPSLVPEEAIASLVADPVAVRSDIIAPREGDSEEQVTRQIIFISLVQFAGASQDERADLSYCHPQEHCRHSMASSTRPWLTIDAFLSLVCKYGGDPCSDPSSVIS